MTLGLDILLDEPDHDLQITHGDLVLEASVAQKIKIRLLFIRGEWFLDIERGVPYFEDIFVKAPNLDHLRAIYRTTVLETLGVTAVAAFDLALNAATRNLSVTFEADTTTGTIEGEVAL